MDIALVVDALDQVYHLQSQIYYRSRTEHSFEGFLRYLTDTLPQEVHSHEIKGFWYSIHRSIKSAAFYRNRDRGRLFKLAHNVKFVKNSSHIQSLGFFLVFLLFLKLHRIIFWGLGVFNFVDLPKTSTTKGFHYLEPLTTNLIIWFKIVFILRLFFLFLFLHHILLMPNVSILYLSN